MTASFSEIEYTSIWLVIGLIEWAQAQVAISTKQLYLRISANKQMPESIYSLPYNKYHKLSKPDLWKSKWYPEQQAKLPYNSPSKKIIALKVRMCPAMQLWSLHLSDNSFWKFNSSIPTRPNL